MTEEQIKLLRLGVDPIDCRTILAIEAGLEWVRENTTLKFDANNDDDLAALPSGVRLFLIKFLDLQSINAGVASESIEGLSQSFNTNDASASVWQYANALLTPYLKSGIRFVPAERRFLKGGDKNHGCKV